jgi:hypothetical protein
MDRLLGHCVGDTDSDANGHSALRAAGNGNTQRKRRQLSVIYSNAKVLVWSS